MHKEGPRLISKDESEDPDKLAKEEKDGIQYMQEVQTLVLSDLDAAWVHILAGGPQQTLILTVLGNLIGTAAGTGGVIIRLLHSKRVFHWVLDGIKQCDQTLISGKDIDTTRLYSFLAIVRNLLYAHYCVSKQGSEEQRITCEVYTLSPH